MGHGCHHAHCQHLFLFFSFSCSLRNNICYNTENMRYRKSKVAIRWRKKSVSPGYKSNSHIVIFFDFCLIYLKVFLYLFEVFYRKEFKICVYVSLSKTGAHQIPVIPEINLYVTLNEFDLQYPTKLLTKYAHVLVKINKFWPFESWK